MRRVQFDMDVNHGRDELRVFADNFGSAAELVEYCKGRKCVSHMEKYDYFNGAEPNNPEWSDFESREDLMNLIESGVRDEKLLVDAGKYAMTAKVKDQEKLTRKCMDVAGGAVNVPAFLSGVPTCMHSVTRKKVKSKIVKIGILCDVLCDISPERYKRAGELMTKTVARLEKAGYRIRLLALNVYEDRDYSSRGNKFDGRRDVWMVSHMIKRENEPMNYRRIMFPLTRVAYLRGLGFAWMAVNGSPYIYGLGGLITNLIDDPGECERLIAKACGEDDYIILSQDEIIGYIQRYGDEKAQQMVDAKVMSLS